MPRASATQLPQSSAAEYRVSPSIVWPPIQEDPDQAPDTRDPIAAIQARLRRYPQARVEVTPNRVTVLPADTSGFEVTFADLGKRYIVACDGWHEHFDSQDEALECFALALSPSARLRVSRRGRTAYRWQFQIRNGAEWVPVSETGQLFYPFWMRRTTVYLQNRLLEAA
jgi:hypothetical protein